MNNFDGSFEQKRMEAQKRKDLPNGSVMATVDGVTAMHLLDKVKLKGFDGTIGDFIKMLQDDIKTKDEKIKLQTQAILSLDSRLKNIEKVVKNYGLE